MKLVTYDNRPGVLVGDDHVFDLSGHGFRSMRELIEATDLASVHDAIGKFRSPAARANAIDTGVLTPLSSVSLMPPVGKPERLYCVGMNYKAHLASFGGTFVPAQPAGFLKNPGSIIASGEPIRLPVRAPSAVEPEGELAVVIGSECFEVSEADAEKHIFGFTILNDVSARDWAGAIRAAEKMTDVIAAWDANLLAKQFPTFAPMGPCIVTKDDIGDLHKVEITTSVNGKTRLQGSPSDFIFSLSRILCYASQFFRFMPGDVISTGSPGAAPGAGGERRFLQSGDVVTVSISGIGELTNTVA
jgi:acylpyruvate hydrolase